MIHKLECVECHNIFTLTEDYLHGYCPFCGIGEYYWDYVLTDDFEEIFDGYYMNELMIAVYDD